jgi:predicted nucleic acid-binding Zn ribbon protein
MPVYVYETVPTTDDGTLERFELRQSMSEPSLTTHPETGVPVRRVVSGGLATFTNRRGSAADRRGGMGCGSGCGCVS